MQLFISGDDALQNFEETRDIAVALSKIHLKTQAGQTLIVRYALQELFRCGNALVGQESEVTWTPALTLEPSDGSDNVISVEAIGSGDPLNATQSWIVCRAK